MMHDILLGLLAAGISFTILWVAILIIGAIDIMVNGE